MGLDKRDAMCYNALTMKKIHLKIRDKGIVPTRGLVCLTRRIILEWWVEGTRFPVLEQTMMVPDGTNLRELRRVINKEFNRDV